MKQQVQKLITRHNRLYTKKNRFSDTVENIISETAVETGMPRDAVANVIAAQFMMIRDVINSTSKQTIESFETYKSIRLIYFGTFLASERKYNGMVKAIKDV